LTGKGFGEYKKVLLGGERTVHLLRVELHHFKKPEVGVGIIMDSVTTLSSNLFFSMKEMRYITKEANISWMECFESDVQKDVGGKYTSFNAYLAVCYFMCEDFVHGRIRPKMNADQLFGDGHVITLLSCTQVGAMAAAVCTNRDFRVFVEVSTVTSQVLDDMRKKLVDLHMGYIDACVVSADKVT